MERNRYMLHRVKHYINVVTGDRSKFCLDGGMKVPKHLLNSIKIKGLKSLVLLKKLISLILIRQGKMMRMHVHNLL